MLFWDMTTRAVSALQSRSVHVTVLVTSHIFRRQFSVLSDNSQFLEDNSQFLEDNSQFLRGRSPHMMSSNLTVGSKPPIK